MPLIKGKSKQAFSHNVETEMKAGKPQDQALAIAYSVKRKKKASGGTVESGSPTMNYADGGKVTSAATEKRPSTEEMNNDRHEIARQGAAKALESKQDMTSPQNRTQALTGMKTQKIKHPRMVPSDALSTRLYDEEGNLQDSASTNEGPQRQPSKALDEEGPDRKGPVATPTDGRRMATQEPKVGRTPDRNMQAVASPSEDEGEENAKSKNEQSPDRQGPAVAPKGPNHQLNMMARGGQVDPKATTVIPDSGFGKIIIIDDNAKEDKKKMMAEGGSIDHEMMEQPTEEAEDMRANSIAAAIMAKRRRMANGGVVDHADMQHPGDSSLEEGQVDIEDNGKELPNAYYGRNEDDVLKENYDEDMTDMTQPMDSNETGDSREDETSDPHDMVDQIRKKMKSRRQMPQE